MSQASVRECVYVDRVRGQLGRVLWWGGGRPGRGKVIDEEEGAELPVEGWMVLDKVECAQRKSHQGRHVGLNLRRMGEYQNPAKHKWHSYQK